MLDAKKEIATIDAAQEITMSTATEKYIVEVRSTQLVMQERFTFTNELGATSTARGMSCADEVDSVFVYAIADGQAFADRTRIAKYRDGNVER